jgi:hypothetical protein
MKKPELNEKQKAAVIASKMTADELSEFFNRVAARLDLYDKKAEESVVARPMKKEH